MTSMFSKPKIAPPPVIQPPAPMPDDNDIEAARRKSIAAQKQRSGRASTVLTEDNKVGL